MQSKQPRVVKFSLGGFLFGLLLLSLMLMLGWDLGVPHALGAPSINFPESVFTVVGLRALGVTMEGMPNA